jgi:hypothetical protein
MIRLPEGAAAPRIGTRIRATGEVGTYYDAPQLAADAGITELGRRAVAPILLRRAPDASLEWRLVRVVVRITDVSRDGDAWKVEASLGAAGSLPIAGLASAAISSEDLDEGRMATITGIVRRAWPTASDQRWSVVPRSADDLRLGPAPRSGSEAGTMGDPSDGFGGEPAGQGSGEATTDPLADSTAPDGTVVARLADIDRFIGRRVRVGARVGAATDDRSFTLQDGTDVVTVRLADALPASSDPLRPGEVVNVTGTVLETAGGTVLAATSSDVTRAARLVLPPSALVSPDPAGATGDGTATAEEASPASGPDPVALASLLLVLTAMVIGGAGTLAWGARRRREAPDGPADAPTGETERGSA